MVHVGSRRSDRCSSGTREGMQSDRNATPMSGTVTDNRACRYHNRIGSAVYCPHWYTSIQDVEVGCFNAMHEYLSITICVKTMARDGQGTYTADSSSDDICATGSLSNAGMADLCIGRLCASLTGVVVVF